MYSDQRIVTAKIRLRLRKNATRRTTTVDYDWVLLNNRNIKDKYAIALRNKFDALQKTEIHTPNDEYENFINSHLEAAAEYMPTKQRTPWETLAVREKRADVKTATECNRKNPTNTNALKLKKAQTYTRINKYIRGSLNKYPDFFRMGTFIDNTRMKLYSPSK